MRTIQRFIFATVTALLTSGVYGATDPPASLNDSVEQGIVVIESVSGTGGSSGSVLNAVLVNTTAVAQQILVHIDAPLFFQNRGESQNMVATQVYGRDGTYQRLGGGRPYVEIAAGSELPVTFVAYCADFDKDNPSITDTFDIAPLPQHIATVIRQIGAYETANRNDISIAASQLALCVAQDHTLDDIDEKFEFDTNDEAIMDAILAISLD